MHGACQIANVCSARLVTFTSLAVMMLSSPAFAYRPFMAPTRPSPIRENLKSNFNRPAV